MYDLAVRGGKVYSDGKYVETNVYIKEGKIAKLTEDTLSSIETVDAKGLFVLPGFIDPHVHMALDLGSATSCDDFESGSVAAAKGGVTTILDFLDPIAHEDDLIRAFEKRYKLAQNSIIDFGFHATLSSFHGDVGKIVKQVIQLGMNSIKVFTTYSESGRMIEKEHLEALLKNKIITMVHAEDDVLVDASWENIATYESSRPLEAELSALDQLLEMDIKGKLYVVHVSSGSGVEKLAGKPNVFVESCPQYFYYDKRVFALENGSLYLLAPPFRAASEKEKLKMNIGNIHTIGTDHCPFKKSEKMASDKASEIPKGVGSIAYSFLLMYNLYGDSIIDRMSLNVADIFGLKSKGRIQDGYDADLVLFDPEGKTVVKGSGVCDYSIYDGLSLKGSIRSTLVRGKFVMKDGKITSANGRYVRGE
jgi:dihydropyrimidinase